MRTLTLSQDNLNVTTAFGGKLVYNGTIGKYYFGDGNRFQRILSMTGDRVGVNTLTPTYTVDVISNTDMVMRLVSDGEYANYVLGNGLNLETKNFNVVNHSQTGGLCLGGVRVVSTAGELNYVSGVSVGVASANRALVLDLNKSVSGVNTISCSSVVSTSTTSTFANITSASVGSLTASTPIPVASGGTGLATYSKGDIIVGVNGNALSRISLPASTGMQLVSDPSAPAGVAWSSHMLRSYISMSKPIRVSAGIFTIDHIDCRDYLDRGFISLRDVVAAASIDNLLGGVVAGVVYPNPESNSVDGSGFTGLKVNDSLVVNGQARRVSAVTSDTNCTVITPFTLLNLWSLSGTAAMTTAQFRFGTRSLTATATTAFATLTANPTTTTPPAWTLEFHVRFASVAAALSIVTSNTAFSLAIGLKLAPVNLTISLGQGTTFNIANATALTSTTIAANTWYHFALVFNGTNYRAFINGALSTTITSTLPITSTAIRSVKVGGGASTFNGWIDEYRFSNIARYSAAFTAPSAQYVRDANTLSLNHFEGTSITNSDDCSNSTNTFSYSRNTQFASDNVQVLHSYAIVDNVYVSPRSSEIDLVDIPSKYSPTELTIRKLPIYHCITASGAYPIHVSATGDGGWSIFTPAIGMIANSTSTAAVPTFMDGYIPSDATMVRLLITHTHVGTISCGITLGSYAEYEATYLTTASASTTQLVVEIPIFGQTMRSRLTAAAGTTSFSVGCLGFFT